MAFIFLLLSRIFCFIFEADQINIDDRYLPQLSSIYASAISEVRDADQQIQLALESSVLYAQQNKVFTKKIFYSGFVSFEFFFLI